MFIERSGRAWHKIQKNRCTFRHSSREKKNIQNGAKQKAIENISRCAKLWYEYHKMEGYRDTDIQMIRMRKNRNQFKSCLKFVFYNDENRSHDTYRSFTQRWFYCVPFFLIFGLNSIYRPLVPSLYLFVVACDCITFSLFRSFFFHWYCTWSDDESVSLFLLLLLLLHHQKVVLLLPVLYKFEVHSTFSSQYITMITDVARVTTNNCVLAVPFNP